MVYYMTCPCCSKNIAVTIPQADPIVEAMPSESIDYDEEMMVWNGRKIEAIKHFRDRTGATLAIAKYIIDEAARGNYTLQK